MITHGHLLRLGDGPGYEDATGTLRVHIASLRKKLEADPSRPRIIMTEPGVGYRVQCRLSVATGSGLEWREVHRGARPGDQFVRIARHKSFKKLGTGRYEIRGEPRLSGIGGTYTRFKRLIIGEPLATAAAGHERLTKLKALAVLSSDALSSVAYATEEIMRVLLLAGTAALSASLRIGAVLVVLLFVVGFSYRQTIKAYPTGGGSYIVAKDNLGTLPGLTAAGSLLISYTLTVAVSVAAGVKALSSAYPELDGDQRRDRRRGRSC